MKMNSQEALQHIINLVCDDTYYRDALNEEFETLQRDLEVLEILKRIDLLVFNNGDKNDFNWYIDTNKSLRITEEEANKIKEWLNDK